MNKTVTLRGFGGGTNPLNFKVVASTSAPNHKDNTIWVNTDAPMTGWVFSPTQPPNPDVDGMIWFPTGTSGNGAFNALKKNSIQLYPTSAKQFISGEWVSKPAQISRNNEWVSWIIYLYRDGDECLETTGGYSLASKLGDSSQYCGGYAKIENNVISVSAYANRAAPETCFGQTVVKKINLTNISSIRIIGTCTSGRSVGAGSAGVGVRVVSTQSLSDSPAAEKTITSEGVFDTSLDVENLSGEYYIIFYAFEYLNGGYSNAYTGSGVFTQALCQ